MIKEIKIRSRGGMTSFLGELQLRNQLQNDIMRLVMRHCSLYQQLLQDKVLERGENHCPQLRHYLGKARVISRLLPPVQGQVLEDNLSLQSLPSKSLPYTRDNLFKILNVPIEYPQQPLLQQEEQQDVLPLQREEQQDVPPLQQ